MYKAKRTKVNLSHLGAALFQWGPWANKKIDFNMGWLKNELIRKATGIDWPSTVSDVEKFLKPLQRHSLDLWSKDFFLNKIEQMVI
jgi:hypothetical protein